MHLPVWTTLYVGKHVPSAREVQISLDSTVASGFRFFTLATTSYICRLLNEFFFMLPPCRIHLIHSLHPSLHLQEVLQTPQTMRETCHILQRMEMSMVVAA